MAETKDKLVTVEILDYVYDILLQKIEDSLTNLPSTAITITSFTNNISSAEMGSTVTSVTLSWVLNKEAASITLDGSVISGSGTSGSTTLNGLNLKGSKTWTLRVTDKNGASATKSTGITFLNRVYYGAASTFSTAGLSSALASSKAKTFTATAGNGEYLWYAVPSRMGTCSFKAGGFEGGFTLVDTKSVTNSNGYTETYYIYRSDNDGLGETTVVVS